MDASKEEKQPLMSGSAEAGKAAGQEKRHHAVALGGDEQGATREWDGHLLSMCGSCDQNGLSTFAYVKLLSPLAWGHNIQRAFGKGFAKHAFIFALLFSAWAWVLVFSQPGPECGPSPFGSQGLLPQQPGPKVPQDQQFLAGATYNPQFAKEQLDGAESDAWMSLEAAKDTAEDTAAEAAPQDQQVMEQVQAAKAQAAEGVAQLGIGRKMLHKHKHDDDDHEHDHKKKGSHKHKDKHALKAKSKKNDHAELGPNSPECMKAQMRMGIIGLLMMASSVIGIVYVTKVRTAIRERYGIKGSKCQDCLAWTFCSPCALCQEVRTLNKNNVHNGVWHGETVFTEQPVSPLKAPMPVEAPTKPV